MATAKSGSYGEAWRILDGIFSGVPSILDGRSYLWHWSVGLEVEADIKVIAESGRPIGQIVDLTSTRSSEELLLLSEVLALAMLPVKNPKVEWVQLFHDLRCLAERGGALFPERLVKAVEHGGYRDLRDDDDLISRLLWCLDYGSQFEFCAPYEQLKASGGEEYLGHDDLHRQCLSELAPVSPWAHTALSADTRSVCENMRFDLDHLLWPNYLAPLSVRQNSQEILTVNEEILASGWGKLSDVTVAKELYLAKQMWGSWDALGMLIGKRAIFRSDGWEIRDYYS